jgi:phosphomannomutase
MSNTASIADLMKASGVCFGTSGARGLAEAMTDRVCYLYTAGFLSYLAGRGEIAPGDRVALAGDLRPSSPRIMRACVRAIRDRGFSPVNCGGAVDSTERVPFVGLKPQASAGPGDGVMPLKFPAALAALNNWKLCPPASAPARLVTDSIPP